MGPPTNKAAKNRLPTAPDSAGNRGVCEGGLLPPRVSLQLTLEVGLPILFGVMYFLLPFSDNFKENICMAGTGGTEGGGGYFLNGLCLIDLIMLRGTILEKGEQLTKVTHP